jgi:hypothetical protein
MQILDDISGWEWAREEIPLEPRGQGRWEAQITPLAGSLLRYRYVLRGAQTLREADILGRPILYRAIHVPSSMQMEDLIAAWEGSAYQGKTGRVIGRLVDGQTGLPLGGMLVNIAGHTRFTDEKGGFRVDGLIPGLHRITAFSPEGAYTPAQQGAIIAEASTTPAQMALFPAPKITLSLEVTVPEGTLEGIPIRVAGNIAPFGHRFTDLGEASASQASLMPALIEVDPTHYIQVFSLYAGTDLRYRYTLGDARWNAERDSTGAPRTRQLILPDRDVVLRDRVESWSGQGGQVQFILSTPLNTPPDDLVAIQFNLGGWSNPIPMWRVGEQSWYYVLYSPLPPGQSIAYRYCRNLLCPGAGEDLSSFLGGQERLFAPGEDPFTLQDQVPAWRWWQGPPERPQAIPDILPRGDLLVGVEWSPAFHPAWESRLTEAMAATQRSGARAVILSPAWAVGGANPAPVLKFDPAYGPSDQALVRLIEEARARGLQLALHPRLRFIESSPDTWWRTAQRDQDWWSTWFDSYRAFLLGYAQLAADNDVELLIVGGPGAAPAYPGGRLADGSPTGVPANAGSRWMGLLGELRAIYRGRIAVEIEMSQAPPQPLEFLAGADEIIVYWHPPLLGENGGARPQEMAQAAAQHLQTLIQAAGLGGIPLSLSVEYLSIDGSALGCVADSGGACLPAEAFALGGGLSRGLTADPQEQATAIAASLAAASANPAVRAVYLRGFVPFIQLQDLSASPHGKPAQWLLPIWHEEINRP